MSSYLMCGLQIWSCYKHPRLFYMGHGKVRCWTMKYRSLMRMPLSERWDCLTLLICNVGHLYAKQISLYIVHTLILGCIRMRVLLLYSLFIPSATSTSLYNMTKILTPCCCKSRNKENQQSCLNDENWQEYSYSSSNGLSAQ